MEQVDLTKAKTLRGTFDETAANKLIEKGWTLISCGPGKDESGYPITKYSFAWFKDGEPPTN